MPATAISMQDGLSTSVAVKPPCVAVATSNITLAGLQTVSGTALAEDDRVLVAGQTDATENGVYNASTGQWQRALDFDGNRDVVNGTRVLVRGGSADGIEYECTFSGNIQFGTTEISFTQRYGANATFDQDSAEVSGGVTPISLGYSMPTRDVRRYYSGSGTFDAAVAACQAAGYRAYLPRPPSGAAYQFSSSIVMKAPGLVGDGPNQTKLQFNGVNFFTLASNEGFDRPQTIYEGFSADSNNGTSCDAKWAFYAPGVGLGAVVVYNSGLIVRNIAIGRNGRVGGVGYLKDVFGAKFNNISVTDAQRVFQLVGSIAQCKFVDIDALLGGSGPGTGLAGGNVGFSTEDATYSSGTLTPEHITTQDLSLIGFDTGLQHAAGIDCNFYDTDVQARVVGISLDAPCDVHGGIIIPHSIGVGAWTGLLIGVSPTTKDARFVSNLQVEVGNTPGTVASSIGIDIGNGSNPTYGVFLDRMRVKGNAASLQNLVRGRILKEFSMNRCVLDHATAASTDVVLSSAERVEMKFNHCSGGTFAIGDGGNAAANGQVEFNQIATLTMSPMTTRSNWKIDINDAIKRRATGRTSIADGGTISHGLSSTPTSVRVCATTSGEFASVTAMAASTFTVAIKKHDNSAGTTQFINWEAEY